MTFQPAPPPPDTFLSPVGQQIIAVLERLREQRKGDVPRQHRPVRKARRRRKGEVSLTEFANSQEIGPRQLRREMLRMGLLQREIVARDRGEGPPLYLHTHRLTPDAEANGLGRRLEPSRGVQYDVLTPKGQQWVAERLRDGERKANPRHAVRETVRSHLREGRSQAEIARLTGLSRQLVSHHARKLEEKLSNETRPCL